MPLIVSTVAITRVYVTLGVQVVAFCWTKIHPASAALADPPLGELYVVAVDPEYQKQGLGTQVALAGLQWLSSRGVSSGILWVEHDNAAALRVYEKMGFEERHRDHGYRISV
jgi:mycothiol synthase